MNLYCSSFLILYSIGCLSVFTHADSTETESSTSHHIDGKGSLILDSLFSFDSKQNKPNSLFVFMNNIFRPDYATLIMESSRYDDIIPELIQSAILTGDIEKYIDISHASTMFHTSGIDGKNGESLRKRKLEDVFANETVQTLRNCNEMIYKFTGDEVLRFAFDYIVVLGGWEAFGIPLPLKLFLTRVFKYGLEAHKICGSCQDFLDDYGGMGDDELYGNNFDDYCGADTYGYDAVVSGLLYLPVDNDGNYLRKDSNLALMNRWIEFTAKEVPSEQLEASPVWETTEEAMEARGFSPVGGVTGAMGIVTLLPDYIGFGESYRYRKGERVFSSSSLVDIVSQFLLSLLLFCSKRCLDQAHVSKRHYSTSLETER